MTLNFFRLVYNVNTDFLDNFKKSLNDYQKRTLDKVATLGETLSTLTKDTVFEGSTESLGGVTNLVSQFKNTDGMEDLIKLSSSEEFSKLTEIDKILLFLITKLDTTPYTKEDQGYIQGAIDLGKVRFVTSDQLANSSPQVLFQVGYGQKVVMEHNGIMISVVKKNTGDPQVQQNMITNNAHNNINNNNFVKLMQYKIDNYENPNTSISPSLSPL